MKILITGGAGFIGSHLCERLLAQGHSVTVLDDLSTGRRENLTSCENHSSFRFVHDTVLNENILYPLMADCQQVYHLAAAVGVKLIVEQPVRTIETNIKGTEAVLTVAGKFGCKVLMASTSEVYGKSEKVPFSEGDDRLLGSTVYSRWSYASSKAIDEILSLAHFKQFGLPVVVVRLFNTVGERQTGTYGMVIPRFVRSALTNMPLVVYGDGSQTRCFGYVGDVIDGFLGLMKNPKAVGQVFNIGALNEISILELAEKIIEKTGSSSEIKKVPVDEVYGSGFEDMVRRVPNLSKINNLIGYTPKIGLDGILDRVIKSVQLELASEKNKETILQPVIAG